MIAMEKGWWKEDLAEFGITEISDHEFPSGPPEMVAMMGGHLDIAYVGAAPPITAIAQGLDAKIVAAVQTQGADLVLRPDIADDYTAPSDLVGLKIATFPPGSIQDTVFKKFLMDNNVSIDDVEIVSMGPGDAMTAIAAKAVDGVFLPHPGPAVIEMEGNGRSVVGSGEMWQDHACCCLLVSDELIRERISGRPSILRLIRTNPPRYSQARSDTISTRSSIPSRCGMANGSAIHTSRSRAPLNLRRFTMILGISTRY
jgi:NitT/TauT family transport system substrate-binding protein